MAVVQSKPIEYPRHRLEGGRRESGGREEERGRVEREGGREEERRERDTCNVQRGIIMEL